MQRREVYFSGRVQGVGFRLTARAVAGRFRVSGYVENLSDARVRMVAEGEPDELDRFITAVEGEMAGYVREVRVERGPATGELAGFVIRH